MHNKWAGGEIFFLSKAKEGPEIFHSEKIRNKLEKLGKIQNNLEQFGKIQKNSEKSGKFWNNLEKFRNIWKKMLK